jgi:murein DD-endopeptidase
MSDAGSHRPSVRLALAAVVLLAFATGCAPFRHGLPAERLPPAVAAATDGGPGEVIAREALAQLGVPYRYGGDDPGRGFDCSGLVAYVHGREGIPVPRTAAAQFAAAEPVPRDELRAGDLVFFRLVPRSRAVTHVGVYTGAGRFVHAPQSGRHVVEASLDDPYFRQRYAGSGRLYPAGPGTGPRLKSAP